MPPKTALCTRCISELIMLQTKENYISHEHTNVQEMLKSFIQAFVK